MTALAYVSIALWGSMFGYVVEYGLVAKRATRVHRAQ